MIFKKLSWSIKRHPFLYKSRFRLLSKSSNTQDIKSVCYNDANPKAEIPDYFNTINTKIFEGLTFKSDLERVQHLSIWLRKNIKGGPGLSLPSDTALKLMLTGKGGVCSDVVQIFNNFCVINNILVREWGITRIPFDINYGGHSFNEVYIKELKKWVLIDVSKCLTFYKESHDTPLSVVELYNVIRSDQEVIHKTFYKTRHSRVDTIVDNYYNPHTAPFLIYNYNNKVYDKSLRYALNFVPIFLVHFVLYAFGKSYFYKFPLDNYKNLFAK